MADSCREELLFHPLTRESVRMKWWVQKQSHLRCSDLVEYNNQSHDLSQYIIAHTCYAMLLSGIPWDIPCVSCVSFVYTWAFSAFGPSVYRYAKKKQFASEIFYSISWESLHNYFILYLRKFMALHNRLYIHRCIFVGGIPTNIQQLFCNLIGCIFYGMVPV